MSKSVWITMIKKDETQARAIYTTVAKYGLGVEGHFWKDDLENMEWSGAVPEIVKSQTGLWLIVGDAEDFSPSVLQGLSLTALTVLAQKGGQIPVMVLADDPDAVTALLPAPLAMAQVFAPDNPALGAKMTAKANLPLKTVASDYRLNIYALPRVGLWLEAGPAAGDWNGIIVGAAGAGIDALGVGPAGDIPQHSTLEYPLRDMKLSLGDREFTAWAVRNNLTQNDAVYVKIKGNPEALIFGPFDPDAEALDVYTLPLC
ncbi:MAG: hypothetical protein SWH61_02370 [Thermodesulfobacteriota bacterium]|nr:hypothetical protein [Thermodesulfobacteriota bacterium]